jgi:hypothetical protein
MRTRPAPPSNGEARSGVHADRRDARYQAFALLRIAHDVAPTPSAWTSLSTFWSFRGDLFL